MFFPFLYSILLSLILNSITFNWNTIVAKGPDNSIILWGHSETLVYNDVSDSSSACVFNTDNIYCYNLPLCSYCDSSNITLADIDN